MERRPNEEDRMKNETSAHKLLVHEHKKLSSLLREYEKTDDSMDKEDVVQNLAMELHIHMMLEEQVFFPALEKEGKAKKLLDDSIKQNDEIKMIIDQLQRLMADQDKKEYDQKMSELKKCVEHHIEQTECKILPKAEDAGLDMKQLGSDLCHARDEMTGKKITEDTMEVPRNQKQPEIHPDAGA
jgi:hypothetical protein